MNPLAHRRMRRAVTAHVGGELDPAAAAAVAAHLRECWPCSGDAELTRMITRSLRNRRDSDALAAIRLRRFATGLTS
jgi:anti-sigma factor RsiW